MKLEKRKTSARKKAQQILQSLNPEKQKEASEKIVQNLFSYLKEISCQKIALFSALCDEPNLSPLIEKLPQKQWLYPLVHKEGNLSFHWVKKKETLKQGNFKIQEPDPETHPFTEIEEIEIFLVPGLAFTEKGNRLGRGKGFYDRALKKKNPQSLILGICFECQITKELPLESHDIAMKHIITEKRIIDTLSF